MQFVASWVMVKIWLGMVTVPVRAKCVGLAETLYPTVLLVGLLLVLEVMVIQFVPLDALTTQPVKVVTFTVSTIKPGP